MRLLLGHGRLATPASTSMLIVLMMTLLFFLTTDCICMVLVLILILRRPLLLLLSVFELLLRACRVAVVVAAIAPLLSVRIRVEALLLVVRLLM